VRVNRHPDLRGERLQPRHQLLVRHAGEARDAQQLRELAERDDCVGLGWNEEAAGGRVVRRPKGGT
jgi:hypothetical protein